MPNKVLWELESISTVLNTELNALGSGGASSLSSEFSNQTSAFRWATFEGIFDWDTSAPTAGNFLSLYMYPAIDGTNYASSAQQITDNLIGRFTIDNILTTQRTALFTHLGGGGVIVPLPPLPLKFILVNDTDQALTSTNDHFVKIRPYNEEVQ